MTATDAPARPCLACTHTHADDSPGPCYEAECVPDCLACQVAKVDDADLLRTFAHLTHLEHSARKDRHQAHPRRSSGEGYAEARRDHSALRAQRDLVQSEDLRRMARGA